MHAYSTIMCVCRRRVLMKQLKKCSCESGWVKIFIVCMHAHMCMHACSVFIINYRSACIIDVIYGYAAAAVAADLAKARCDVMNFSFNWTCYAMWMLMMIYT